MPNIKSAKKRVLVNEKKTEQNKAIRSAVKTEMKKVDALIKEGKLEEAKAALVTLAMEDKANITANKIFNGAVEGRVSKQLKDICLLDQTYVKAEDGKQTVAAYLKSVNNALVIKNVVRFEVGEGMEKKNEDFAAEVAAQLG